MVRARKIIYVPISTIILTIPNNHFFYATPVQDNNVFQGPGVFFIVPPLDADIFPDSIDIDLSPSPIFMDGLTTDSQQFSARVPRVNKFSAATKTVSVNMGDVCR